MSTTIEEKVKEADMALNYVMLDCLRYLSEREKILLCQANAYWIDFVKLECEFLGHRYPENSTEKLTASSWGKITLFNQRIADIQAMIQDRISHG